MPVEIMLRSEINLLLLANIVRCNPITMDRETDYRGRGYSQTSVIAVDACVRDFAGVVR